MEPQALITATVFPFGITAGSNYSVSRKCSTNLIAADIGEVAAEAVHKAWKNGYDPAKPDFVVLLTFK